MDILTLLKTYKTTYSRSGTGPVSIRQYSNRDAGLSSRVHPASMVNSIFKQGVIALVMTLSMCAIAIGQGSKQSGTKTGAEDLTWVRSSPAYAEIQVKRTEVLSELESLLLDYQEEYPKVKELRLTLLLLDRDIARISRVKVGEASKLTLALGKLMLTKVELETELGNLQKKYKDDHPDVRRARKKIEVYDAAINDILN